MDFKDKAVGLNLIFLKLDKLITKKFKLEQINDVADAMLKRQIHGRWVCNGIDPS